MCSRCARLRGNCIRRKRDKRYRTKTRSPAEGSWHHRGACSAGHTAGLSKKKEGSYCSLDHAPAGEDVLASPVCGGVGHGKDGRMKKNADLALLVADWSQLP